MVQVKKAEAARLPPRALLPKKQGGCINFTTRSNIFVKPLSDSAWLEVSLRSRMKPRGFT
jgi:hypothetical protein